MRNDFAALILTHGRADNVITVKTLAECGYTGKYYIVIDDEDEQEQRYKEIYGDRVRVFCKQNVYDRIDTMDNFNRHGSIVYARNAAFDIAEQEGLKYFLELDDDYTSFDFRIPTEDKLGAKKCKNLDRLFEAMLRFLDDSGADSVALSQGGDYIGGIGGSYIYKGISRKAMNSFFLRTDNRFEFKGTINEDVNTYTALGSQGKLFMSVTNASLVQKQTQQNAGGMTDIYLDCGTYLKSFYSVVCMPSAVKVSIMGATHRRIHHRVQWENCVPEIISERYKKVNT